MISLGDVLEVPHRSHPSFCHAAVRGSVTTRAVATVVGAAASRPLGAGSARGTDVTVVHGGEWWLVEPNGKATRNHGMLRSEARLGGRPFYVLEVERAGYDEEFEDPVFRIALRPGRRFTGA